MMIKFHGHHPFNCSPKTPSAWYSCKHKPNTNDCMRTLSQLLDILYDCTPRLDKYYWMCLKQTENEAAQAGRSFWRDEIHLNVIMISVWSPPGCIFVKEDKKKRTEYVESFPCQLIDPQHCEGVQVKQRVPYLKNEAFIGTCLHIIKWKP